MFAFTANARRRQLLNAAASHKKMPHSRPVDAALPAVVERYFDRCFGTASRDYAAVRLQQRGRLRSDVNRQRWWAFSAQQHSTLVFPGFDWQATLQLALGFTLKIRDSYYDGAAYSKLNFIGLPLAHAGGSNEHAEAALQRYLAEAVWYPQALLPSDCLVWQEGEKGSAVAVLDDGGHTVSMRFHFDSEGEVTRVSTPERFCWVNDGYEKRPWEGRFCHYQRRSGMWVPTSASAAWHVTQGVEEVWQGELTDVQYILQADL